MKKNYIIKVVSYKRPKNNTCDMLLKTNLNWKVYVYYFDEYLLEYIKNYKEHVNVITSFNKANLAKKRQLVLDDSIKEKYDYCIMLDDDIIDITLNNEKITLDKAIKYMLNQITNKYIAMSAAYHSEKYKIIKNKNICNNSIFNLLKYKNSNIRYNEASKCEDAEFTIDLLLNNYTTGRLGFLIIKNTLQGGQTNDGLSYRFTNNRFIIEGNYLSKKYKNLNIFDYDENHLSIKTEKIKKSDKNEN